MKIDDLIPYEKNARDHSKSINALMESIKEFGFRGKIQVRSKDDPVIVNGHGRVEACKRLGWTEFPDEFIEFVGDLSDDKVKEYRLADNRVAELSTWKKTLLQHEVKAVKADMGKYGFDFKSRYRPYGAERSRTNRAYNLDMVDIDECDGAEGYPVLYPTDARPRDFISFNFCKTAIEFDVGVHFCIDDYQFERVWNKPSEYLELLKKFDCVVCPDFSVYMDMPIPMRRWNVYRSRALGNYWQRNGINVVPNITFADGESYGYCFDGMPKGGTVFVSTIGVTKNKSWSETCKRGVYAAVDYIKPKRLLLLGSDLGMEFPFEVVKYSARSF